jgi:hypothetical protein
MAKIKSYIVRVTRSFEDEYADIDVRATSWKAAKKKAIAEVEKDPDSYFGDDPDATIHVDAADDDEESALVQV